jgi:hypothetical protein
VYAGVQTNTFTFNEAVSIFSVDFRGFDGLAFCPRMEIKVNGVFYPLTIANLEDLPTGTTCTGSFSRLSITADGYLTVNMSTGPSTQGRITISNVNANNVSISTNDGSGTCFSDPFNCTTIPLKLESFTGKSKNCKVLLNWKTGIEQNVKRIEIERSEDGTLFYKAGEATPKGSNSHYSFITTNSKDVYFRLKIIDLDGYYEYSNIISIKSNCNNIFYQVIPNPASNSIEIMGLQNDDKVIILDMLGRKVLAFNSSQNNNKFDIEQLTSGMYILQVINSGLIKSNQKVIKN